MSSISNHSRVPGEEYWYTFTARSLQSPVATVPSNRESGSSGRNEPANGGGPSEMESAASSSKSVVEAKIVPAAVRQHDGRVVRAGEESTRFSSELSRIRTLTLMSWITSPPATRIVAIAPPTGSSVGIGTGTSNEAAIGALSTPVSKAWKLPWLSSLVGLPTASADLTEKRYYGFEVYLHVLFLILGERPALKA